MKSRHLARAIAVQTLYSLDFNGRLYTCSVPYSDLFAGYTQQEQDKLEIDVSLYASFLINGVLSRLNEIDEVINRFSSKRSLENISLVDRNILRVSFYTLLYCTDIHPNIVIDEAVKLSQEYSTEVNYKFINGLLDTAVRHLHDSPKN